MRKRFQQQGTLGITPISEVVIDTKSRDGLPAVLLALQHIFITPQLNNAVFSVLESKVSETAKKTGRPGMDLWHILVLAVLRHTLSTDWDRVEYLSNNDKSLRKIMGVHVEGFGIEEMEFAYQTILDNVSLIDEQMLHQINDIVVNYGQQLLKKKEGALVVELKTDSYVVESNIHFPTDLNLLYDSLRKGIKTVASICRYFPTLKGWRKHKSVIRDLKSLFRNTSQKVFKGRDEQQKKQFVRMYLSKARAVCKKLELVNDLVALPVLEQYIAYIRLFTDQIERRLLKGETIPASEKIYSIFEPHTEWITKGKQHKKVELGHLVLITTDQHSFIVDYKVMEKQKDVSQITDLKDRLTKKYAGATIKSCSFDKGFWSKENLEQLQQTDIQYVVLPKKGKHNQQDQQRESQQEFKHYRRKHSAIESNINMLEHHGLNRCPDKGLKQYKRYVGLSVLAYNVHQLGNKLIALEKEKDEKLRKKAERVLKKAA